jgi:hypothetical protein
MAEKVKFIIEVDDKGTAVIKGFGSTAEKEFGRVSKSVERTNKIFSKWGKTLSIGVTLPLLGIGTAALKMAVDVEESENLFRVSMGNMADAAQKWSEELSDALGLNEYEIRKLIGTFNVMFTSMGLGEKAAFGMAKGLTQLTYDMASFYNLRPEEAFLKLQAAISGEVEPLKKLGIVVNETTIKHTALKHGLIKTGEKMSETQKVIARYLTIMEQTSKAQGDLARTLESPANQMRILKSRVEKLMISFGKLLIPILQKLISIIDPVVKWFENLDEGQKKLIVTLGAVAAAVGPVLLVFGKFAAILPGLAKTLPLLKAGLTSLISPLGLITAGATAAAMALNQLINKYKEKQDAAIAAIKKQSSYLGEWFKLRKMASEKEIASLEQLRDIWHKYGRDAKKAIQAIAEGKEGKELQKLLEDLRKKHEEAGKGAGIQADFLKDLKQLFGETGNKAQQTGEKIKTAFEILGVTSVTKFKEETEKLTQATLKLWDEYQKGNVFAEDMEKAVLDLIERYKQLGQEAPQAILEIRDSFHETIPAIRDFSDVINQLPEVHKEATEKINQKNKELSENWKNIINGIREHLANNLAQMIMNHQSFTETLKNLWEDLKSFIIREVIDRLATSFTSLFFGILQGAQGAATGMATSFGSAISKVISGIGNVISSLVSMLPVLGKIALAIGAIVAAVAAIKAIISGISGGGKKYSEITYWLKDYNERIFPQYMEAVLTELRNRLPDVKEFQASFNTVKASRKLLVDIRGILRESNKYLNKIANKIQGAQSGFYGVVTKPTLFAVAENRPEEVFIRPVTGGIIQKPTTVTREIKQTIIINPTFNINAVDGSDVLRITREKIIPELVTAIKLNYNRAKTEFKEALELA